MTFEENQIAGLTWFLHKHHSGPAAQTLWIVSLGLQKPFSKILLFISNFLYYIGLYENTTNKTEVK